MMYEDSKFKSDYVKYVNDYINFKLNVIKSVYFFETPSTVF